MSGRPKNHTLKGDTSRIAYVWEFNSQIMSLVSALNENDDLETSENSSEDSATDLETDFEKHDDWIGFSAPAGLLKTTTRRELRTKSDLCMTLHASWFINEC